MKILLILASTGPMVGGMEKQVALQANYMSKIKGAKVSVIASPCFKDLFEDDIYFTGLKMSRSRRNLALLFNLHQVVSKNLPDIIHAHGHKAASMLSTLKPFLSSHIKLIASSHGLKRNNKALKKMDEVFVVSEGIQDVVSPIHSVVIHNGIEACTLPPSNRAGFCKNLGLNPKRPLILGVGRLVKTKQFERLIQAAKGLEANIVILGDGPDRAYLESIASENVCLTGYRSDTRSLLYIADMMVICSERDGFSLALIEALHSHLPVLSTRVPGAQDLLPENCLIDSTDEAKLRQFIQKHLDNIEQLKLSQQKQFQYAQNELKIERVAERTYKQYREVISA